MPTNKNISVHNMKMRCNKYFKYIMECRREKHPVYFVLCVTLRKCCVENFISNKSLTVNRNLKSPLVLLNINTTNVRKIFATKEVIDEFLFGNGVAQVTHFNTITLFLCCFQIYGNF